MLTRCLYSQVTRRVMSSSTTNSEKKALVKKSGSTSTPTRPKKFGNRGKKDPSCSSTFENSQIRPDSKLNILEKKQGVCSTSFYNQVGYAEYKPLSEVQQGIADGDIITGALRVNPRKYFHAFVSDQTGRDILIDGMIDRNRALENDIVAIKLKDKNDWVSGFNSKKTKNLTNEMQQLTIDNQKNLDQSTSECNDIRKTGFVVAIMEKKNPRCAVGLLKVEQAKKMKKPMAIFSPCSPAFPRIHIPMSSLKDVILKKDADKILFAAKITDWPVHQKMPTGTLCEMVGESGNVEAETKRILIDHDVDFKDFSEDVIECLPNNMPWTIPEEERKKRKDFTSECVFTIDPATARDLDDALHCKKLSNGNFEVGVHIADVSFFVEPSTALDKVASNRCTSVYLVQKVIPMLPHLLCEELCSLNPGTERLAFSVVWTINQQGEVLSQWIGRSIIRSCAKFSYDHAQLFIDNPAQNFDEPSSINESEFPAIHGGFSLFEIKKRVLNLYHLSRCLRAQRFENGALRLDQVKLSYTLDEESGLPNGCYAYERKGSNELIEEFMLLANLTVAHKLHEALPTYAFLRSHPQPKEVMMDDVVMHCNAVGIGIDSSSSGTLAASIDASCGEDALATFRKQTLYFFVIKPQQLAIYLCAGMQLDESAYHHYALNVPLYTHFTSPIRRYADVIVHRQLACVLENVDAEEKLKLTAAEIQKQAELCNHRKYNSKIAQELSVELFFNLLVKNFGPLESNAMVLYVYDHSFDVLSMEYGVKKRVYVDSLSHVRYKLEEKSVPGKNLTVNVLKLKWLALDEKNGTSTGDGARTGGYDETAQTYEQTIEVFSVVKIILRSHERESKVNSIQVSLKHPLQDIDRSNEGC